MTYTADATELAIKNQLKRKEQEDKHHLHMCYGVLVAWGRRKDKEPDQEVGLKSPCTSQARSGDALEVDPSIPHIVLTGDEYDEICKLIGRLGGVYIRVLKIKFVDRNNDHFEQSKVDKINLGQAITKFSQNYQLGS